MLHMPLFKIHEIPVTLENILTFFGALIVFWLIAKCVKSAVMRIKMPKHHVNETSFLGVGRLAYYSYLNLNDYKKL